MSSHHIVRDEQEPAVLIQDPQALEVDFVDSLLEWSPTVMVLEPALKEVLKWGIKIDIVVAFFDSIESLKPKLQEQSPVKLLGFESGDLLENAYQFLLENNYSAVNVLGDIFNSQVLEFARLFSSKIDSVVFYNNQKWVYARQGIFEKWIDTGKIMAIHPVSSNTFLTTEGFYTEWENEMLIEPIELTSELSGKVKIQTNQKPLWVVEDLLNN